MFCLLTCKMCGKGTFSQIRSHFLQQEVLSSWFKVWLQPVIVSNSGTSGLGILQYSNACKI